MTTANPTQPEARKVELPKQRPSQRPTGSKGQLDWQDLKALEDKVTGIQVSIQVLPLFIPKFRITISGTGREGQSTRSLNPGIRVDNGKAVVQAMFGMTLARLVDEALLICQDETQAAADRDMDRMVQREERRDKPQDRKPSPLGTALTPEQREAKKKRHENNLAARRSADQERTSKTKGR